MSNRRQKVEDQIKQELAQLIQLEVRDPRIGLISVTDVKVSRDLAHAEVYFTTLSQQEGSQQESQKEQDQEVEANVAALNNAAGFLRSLLAKIMNMRTTPKLHFRYDTSIARGQYISNLIDCAIAEDRKGGGSEE